MAALRSWRTGQSVKMRTCEELQPLSKKKEKKLLIYNLNAIKQQIKETIKQIDIETIKMALKFSYFMTLSFLSGNYD